MAAGWTSSRADRSCPRRSRSDSGSRRATAPSSPPATRSSPAPRSPSGSATRDCSSFPVAPAATMPGRASAGRRSRRDACIVPREPTRASSSIATAATGARPSASTPSRSNARRRAWSARCGPGSASASRPRAGRSSASRRSATRRAAGCRSAATAATSATAGCAPRRSTSAWRGRSSSIGSRVDAEALTRARAMGVRGVIVSGLAGKERRDFLASESRQRAALHRLPPFAVLILDGVIRRPIAGSDRRDPRGARRDDRRDLGRSAGARLRCPERRDRPPRADHVRVRSGEHAGEEGRWAGLAGIRRFAGGTFLEAGWVIFGDDPPRPVPLGGPRAVRLTMAGRRGRRSRPRSADRRRRREHRASTVAIRRRETRRARGAARPPRRAPATSSACGATSARARRSSRRGSPGARHRPTPSTRRRSC